MSEADKSPHPDSDAVVAKKLAAIRRAALYEHPTSDFETMLAEIERGYEIELEFPPSTQHLE
jgi:hypothetical protein